MKTPILNDKGRFETNQLLQEDMRLEKPEPAKMHVAAQKTIKTAKTATSLAKAHQKREYNKHGGLWQWMDFPGPKGRESAGIFDILAIRKKMEIPAQAEFKSLKHLDLFDIMLIQVKSGNAHADRHTTSPAWKKWLT